MDIAGLFDYEALYELSLAHPKTEEPLGIVFMIRSASSPEAKKIRNQHVDVILERQQRGKLIKGKTAIQRELEKAASYIADWDWGENTYQGEIPEFSFKKAMEILESEDWIFEAVVEAANELGNFTAT